MMNTKQSHQARSLRTGERCGALGSSVQPGPRRRSLRHARSESGIAMLETAIVIPVVALLLFALIEFGLAFARYQVVTNAAAAAARAAALFRINCQDDQLIAAARGAVTRYVGTMGLTATQLNPNVTGTSGIELCRSPSLTVEIAYTQTVPLVSVFAGFFSDGTSGLASGIQVRQRVSEFNENAIGSNNSST